MTPSWRTLEAEIISILRGHHFDIIQAPDRGDTMLKLSDWDFPVNFSITTFAKDLAKRLEQSK